MKLEIKYAIIISSVLLFGIVVGILLGQGMEYMEHSIDHPNQTIQFK